MATEEIEISQLELADEILADMVTPVETATETKAITLSQLRKWLGSSLPTGFILPAVGRIEDSRFTLLDGKTLSRTGTYEDFCNKVIEQVNTGNWFSCTQAEYDQDLSNYGQCGRFVIETDYVRIPTITRYIGATITLSEIGKTYKESLPNVKFDLKNILLTSGASVSTGVKTIQINYTASGNQSTGAEGITGIDASLLSSTYQDGAKVQPDHTKYPYYMVVSTEGQTDPVEVDINNVYEDINLKANKDLSDVSQAGKTTVSGWGMPSNNYIDIPEPQNNGVNNYTAPANGYIYYGRRKTGGDNGLIYIVNTTNHIELNAANYLGETVCTVLMPVRKNDVCILGRKSLTGQLIGCRFYYAIGELS